MSEIRASAPGRVNLIGEHTDYNGGMVLPAALSVGLELTLQPRSDQKILVRSSGYKNATRTLTDLANGDWSDPVVGALREAQNLGLVGRGADIEVRSTIPAGSGLSSSAALIVAVLKAAREAATGTQTDVELAVAARRVENEFMGVPCGIMDQMAVALATPGKVMALDTKSLNYELVELPKTHTIAVVHSGVFRQLTEGRYAERKEECDQAKAFFATDDLCLLDPEEISQSSLAETPRKRALHCATEHRRVVKSIAALKRGDAAALGESMNESHISMRDEFQMSVSAIDALVETAQNLGATGARLTGGGFGGCIVACVENHRLDGWKSELIAAHPNAKCIDTVTPS